MPWPKQLKFFETSPILSRTSVLSVTLMRCRLKLQVALHPLSLLTYRLGAIERDTEIFRSKFDSLKPSLR